MAKVAEQLTADKQSGAGQEAVVWKRAPVSLQDCGEEGVPKATGRTRREGGWCSPTTGAPGPAGRGGRVV